jgi:hypothetical protein
MNRDEFEEMSRTQVSTHAREEHGVQRGKPLYYDRPWSQVLDEMEDADARTVGALDATRIAVLHEGITTAEPAKPGREP